MEMLLKVTSIVLKSKHCSSIYYLEPFIPQSRGTIVQDFIHNKNEELTAENYAGSIDISMYSGFSAIIGDSQGCYYVSNNILPTSEVSSTMRLHPYVRSLSPNVVYGISNGHLDHWDKVILGKKLMRNILGQFNVKVADIMDHVDTSESGSSGDNNIREMISSSESVKDACGDEVSTLSQSLMNLLRDNTTFDLHPLYGNTLPAIIPLASIFVQPCHLPPSCFKVAESSTDAHSSCTDDNTPISEPNTDSNISIARSDCLLSSSTATGSGSTSSSVSSVHRHDHHDSHEGVEYLYGTRTSTVVVVSPDDAKSETRLTSSTSADAYSSGCVYGSAHILVEDRTNTTTADAALYDISSHLIPFRVI